MWLTEKERSRTKVAEEAGFASPVPTQIVSNGEYNPLPQTESQKKVEGRIKELAALLDGESNDHQTLNVLTRLAAQHNQRRATQSIADDRYEIRWEEAAVPISSAEAGEGSAWILVADDADAVRPLVDVLTARGHRHRILGLPACDADEEQLEAELRAATADEPAPGTLRSFFEARRSFLLRWLEENAAAAPK